MKHVSNTIKYILIITFIYSCGSGNNSEITPDLINNPVTASGKNNDTSILPKFQWYEQVHDFGVIIQGEKVSHSFRFKNTGKSNLIISTVHASCGCTVPKYDTQPIAPGKEGYIEIIFDSNGRSGSQNKTITVLANTQPNTVELHFTSEVIVPEKK